MADGRAGLYLEVDTSLLLVGHLKDLNLHLGVLIYRLFVLLTLVVVIDASLHVKRQLPVRVRHLELLLLLCHLHCQLGEQIVRAEVGEEGLREAVLVAIVLLDIQAVDFRGVGVLWRLILVAKVHLAFQLEVSARASVDLVALRNLPIFLLS